MFVKEVGEVPFGLLVWNTGLAPNPLVQSISEYAKSEKTGRYIYNVSAVFTSSHPLSEY